MDSALRGVVMRCLGAMCESGQQLVDLFVNYDCDLEARLPPQVCALGCAWLLVEWFAETASTCESGQQLIKLTGQRLRSGGKPVCAGGAELAADSLPCAHREALGDPGRAGQPTLPSALAPCRCMATSLTTHGQQGAEARPAVVRRARTCLSAWCWPLCGWHRGLQDRTVTDNPCCSRLMSRPSACRCVACLTLPLD